MLCSVTHWAAQPSCIHIFPDHIIYMFYRCGYYECTKSSLSLTSGPFTVALPEVLCFAVIARNHFLRHCTFSQALYISNPPQSWLDSSSFGSCGERSRGLCSSHGFITSHECLIGLGSGEIGGQADSLGSFFILLRPFLNGICSLTGYFRLSHQWE